MRSFPKMDWRSRRNCWALSRMTSFPRNGQQKIQLLEGRLPDFTYVELKSDKSPLQQQLRSLTPAKSLGNTWVKPGLTQKPIKIKGSLCRSPGGFCLNAEMPHKWKRDETLRRGWEQLLFSFTQELSFFLFVEGPERLCWQRVLKDSLQCTGAFNAFEMLMKEAEAGSPWMTHNESQLGWAQVATAPNWGSPEPLFEVCPSWTHMNIHHDSTTRATLLDSYLRSMTHFIRVGKWEKISWTVPLRSPKRSGERDTQPVPLAASSYWGTSSAAGARGNPGLYSSYHPYPLRSPHCSEVAMNRQRKQWRHWQSRCAPIAKPVQFHLHLSLSPTLFPQLRNWLSSCCGNTAD